MQSSKHRSCELLFCKFVVDNNLHRHKAPDKAWRLPVHKPPNKYMFWTVSVTLILMKFPFVVISSNNKLFVYYCVCHQSFVVFVHAFMLRRPSPSLLCSVYRNSTEKIFVIKKFIFSFHPETDKEKKRGNNIRKAGNGERWKHVFLTWRHTTANKTEIVCEAEEWRKYWLVLGGSLNMTYWVLAVERLAYFECFKWKRFSEFELFNCLFKLLFTLLYLIQYNTA